jgi:CMP/dCMP kinase
MDLEIVENASTETQRLPIIAIDGPAGAGKSTAARLLAYQLGFTLIDTGALYRVLALMAMEADIQLTDGPALQQLAKKLEISFGKLELREGESIPILPVFCNGVEITKEIRSPEIGMAASNVSKLPEVREALLQMQRDFGELGGIVMEGRDIGTVIFPDANIKFFLTASVESRAQRRWEELQGVGSGITLDQVIVETRSRDDQDTKRAHAPLRQAEDALLIDSTAISLSAVVQHMATIVREKLKTQ